MSVRRILPTSISIHGGTDARPYLGHRQGRPSGRDRAARACGRDGPPSAGAARECLAAGLLGLGRHQIYLGTRGIHGGSFSQRRVGGGSLGQTRPRLGLG
jgi:hypothetical protein